MTLKFKVVCYHSIMWGKMINTLVFLNLVFLTQDNGFWVYFDIHSFCSDWPAKHAVVQSPSQVWIFMTPWAEAHQASLCLTISWSLPKFMSIASMMPSSHLILWCPLLLHSVFHNIRDFSNESSACIQWPKYWSFSFSIRPSNKYSGLISFKLDWFDLLAVQGTSRSLI